MGRRDYILFLAALPVACAQLVGADFDDDFQLEDPSSTTTVSAAVTTSTSGAGGSTTIGTSASSGTGVGGGTGGGPTDLCGNGIIDGDETCDGDCPTSCVDGDRCTVDTVVGAAADCDLTCTALPVACGIQDGCCPPNCADFQDFDCPSPALDNVLVVGNGSPSFLNAVRDGLVATNRFSDVQTFNAAASLITQATLSTYAAVLVFSNTTMGFTDPVVFGDELAQYYDNGGRVVVTTAAQCGDFGFQGRFVTNGYRALEGPGFDTFPDAMLATLYEPGSFLWSGINPLTDLSIDEQCRTTLTTGAVALADWNGPNGPVPAAARIEVGGRWRVDVNIFPPGADAAGFEMLANALYFE
ncbi:MAG: hypothetical protein AAGN82_02175 [Myxococcota bacterium]